jgi:hypothetical protein
VQSQAVRSLIELHPQINLNELRVLAEEWYTPLIAAIAQGRLQAVDLLEKGADAVVVFPKIC